MESAFLYSDYKLSNIRMRRETFGGSTYDVGCYCTSQILWMIGEEPETVQACGRFSKEKILAAGGPGKVAFSTTNYHVFRSGLCARRVKMRAVGMGAKTKWYFWPNAAVREFVGLLTEHRGKQALIFGGMIVFYVALTILAYQ